QPELTAGELPAPLGLDRDRPRGDVAATDLLAGLGVDHRDAGVQDHAFAQHGTTSQARALRHHAPAADEAVVLHDHGRRLRGLEHPADADTPGEVDVGADLGARP